MAAAAKGAYVHLIFRIAEAASIGSGVVAVASAISEEVGSGVCAGTRGAASRDDAAAGYSLGAGALGSAASAAARRQSGSAARGCRGRFADCCATLAALQGAAARGFLLGPQRFRCTGAIGRSC